MPEAILDFVREETLILVPVLWIVGRFIKKSDVPNQYIVWVLLAIGVGFSLWMEGLNPEAVIQGILVAGAAVFVHQLFKQTRELAEKKEVRRDLDESQG